MHELLVAAIFDVDILGGQELVLVSQVVVSLLSHMVLRGKREGEIQRLINLNNINKHILTSQTMELAIQLNHLLLQIPLNDSEMLLILVVTELQILLLLVDLVKLVLQVVVQLFGLAELRLHVGLELLALRKLDLGVAQLLRKLGIAILKVFELNLQLRVDLLQLVELLSKAVSLALCVFPFLVDLDGVQVSILSPNVAENIEEISDFFFDRFAGVALWIEGFMNHLKGETCIKLTERKIKALLESLKNERFAATMIITHKEKFFYKGEVSFKRN